MALRDHNSQAHTTKTSDLEKPSTITPTSFVNVIPLPTVHDTNYNGERESSFWCSILIDLFQ